VECIPRQPGTGRGERIASATIAQDRDAPRLAYLSSVFPATSETFVANEVLALRRRGVEVVPFALRRHRAGELLTSDPGHAELLRITHYSPYLWCAEVPRALWWALRTRPGRLFRCMGLILRGLWHYPEEFIKTWMLFPKAVRFAREMEEARVEHLHAHWASYPTTAALFISLLTDIPYSFTCHAHDVYLFEALFPEKLKHCAFASPAHEHVRQELLRKCAGGDQAKALVLRVGVDVDQFERVPYHRKHDAPWQMLAVGRLAPMKGHIYLIRALAQLVASGARVQCKMVGEGPLRGELEAEIRSHGLEETVLLLGARPNEEVRRSLSEADVFVLPSIVAPDGQTEGIPFALMEAMACGLPVVASEVGGIRELVRHEENGLMVSPGDVDLLASNLRRLYEDDDLSIKLGAAARETVVRSYNAQVELDKKLGLFRKHRRG